MHCSVYGRPSAPRTVAWQPHRIASSRAHCSPVPVRASGPTARWPATAASNASPAEGQECTADRPSPWCGPPAARQAVHIPRPPGAAAGLRRGLFFTTTRPPAAPAAGLGRPLPCTSAATYRPGRIRPEPVGCPRRPVPVRRSRRKHARAATDRWTTTGNTEPAQPPPRSPRHRPTLPPRPGLPGAPNLSGSTGRPPLSSRTVTRPRRLCRAPFRDRDPRLIGQAADWGGAAPSRPSRTLETRRRR